MRLLFANLLLKYTKCSVRTAGTTISLVWTWPSNSLRWDLHGVGDTKIILTTKNTLKMIRYYRRTKMHLQMRKHEQEQSSNIKETQ